MIIDTVYNEIGEPGCLSGSLEELEEQGETLLPEVVPEDLEGHQGGAVVEKRLRNECQPLVIDVVVCHVHVH